MLPIFLNDTVITQAHIVYSGDVHGHWTETVRLPVQKFVVYNEQNLGDCI